MRVAAIVNAVFALAFLVATAPSALAKNVHVQNCVSDGKTHEFVSASEDFLEDAEHQKKTNIAYGSSAELNCNQSDSCMVKMHGSDAWYDIYDDGTFYGGHTCRAVLDTGCSGATGITCTKH